MKSLYSSLFLTLFIIPISVKSSVATPFKGTIPLLGHKNGIAFFDVHPQEVKREKEEEKQEKATFSMMRRLETVGTVGERVNLNNQASQPNPLLNQPIRLMSFFGNSPLVVPHQKPNMVFWVSLFDKPNTASLKSFDIVNKDQKPVEIVGLGSNIVDQPDQEHSYIFTAVKKHDDILGGEDSAIVRAHLNVRIHENEKNRHDSYSTSIFEVKDFIPLSFNAPFLSWNGPLRAFNNDADRNPVCFHWCTATQRLYVGFSVTTGPHENNGGCALAMLQLLPFKAIVPLPLSALERQEGIIGAQGSDVTITIHKIESMVTHTHIPYLIVAGGVGEQAVLQGHLSALPLVSAHGRFRGMIASRQSVINNQASPDFPFRWLSRSLSEPVGAPFSMHGVTDSAVQVGGAPLGAPITDIEVKGDAIFVSTSGSAVREPGVYHSQALCSFQGVIKNWTRWKKIAGSHKPVTHCWHDALDNLYFCEREENSSTICQLRWSKNNSLNRILEEVFKKEEGVRGGVQCYNETVGASRPYMVFTGKETIVIFVGDDKGYGVEKGYYSDNGSLNDLKEFPDTFIITGGALKEVGMIKTATIVVYNDQAWLLVGGEKGVGVLQDPLGQGFNPAYGLTTNLAFKLYGSYSKVRKIIFDKGMLYILTNSSLERITIDNEQWLSNAVPVVVAQESMNNEQYGFFDCIISGPRALVGTHNGLLQAQGDITVAQNSEDAQWRPVVLGDSEGPITHLMAISPTGIETEVAQGAGGVVYVINNSIAFQRSRIYRIDMHAGTAGIPFEDYWLRGLPSFFMSFPLHCAFITTDGMSLIATPKKHSYSWMFKLGEVMNGKSYLKSVRKMFPDNIGNAARCYYSPALKKWILLEPYNLYIYE